MGILDLSPEKVRIIRDALIIGVIGMMFVLGAIFSLQNLQQSLTWIIP